MPQTMSVTEARDKFPALVRQVSGTDKAVVITSRNKPQVVLLDYEAFRRRRKLEDEGARARLARLVAEARLFVEGALEGYRPDSLDLYLFPETFEQMARQMWETSRALDRPRRLLAVTIFNAILNFRESGERLTKAHLSVLAEVLPLLEREDLVMDEVAVADRRLLAVGLNAVFPVEGDLATLYEEDLSPP